jgi:hypothetical protein
MKSRAFVGVPFLLIVMSAISCSRTAAPRARPAGGAACIQIREVVPEIAQVDDSGNSIEAVRLGIEAYGGAEDLRRGEAIYTEDDREMKVIPVGDLHPGSQTIAIPPGLHIASSSEQLEVTLLAPDGRETLSLMLPLNSVGYVPPPKPRDSGQRTRKPSESSGDAEQEIATILPDVDPDEVMSIRQFGPADVGVTSFDGDVDLTEGDDAHQPPQTLTLRGVNFKDGLVVRFRTNKGGQRVTAEARLMQTKTLGTLTVPSGSAPTNPSALFASVVVVPTKVTHTVRSGFAVRSLHGETRSECK